MPLPDEIEHRYYTSQGFDPAHARQVRSHYLPFVDGRELLVELGCGRGEFLEVASEVVERCLGVDADPAMVEAVVAAGHDAVRADVRTWPGETTERPDAVFLAHLIEHLSVDEAHELLGGVHDVMAPGGVLVVVTPNPACLANLMNDFWSDPTHVRLYTLDLLAFLLEQTGFEVTERGGNPIGSPGAPPLLAAPPVDVEAGELPVGVDPPAPIQYDESFQLETLLDETSRLRRAVEQLVHGVATLDARQQQLRHVVDVLAQRHDDVLAHLWGPNEIYVVGVRRP